MWIELKDSCPEEDMPIALKLVAPAIDSATKAMSHFLNSKCVVPNDNLSNDVEVKFPSTGLDSFCSLCSQFTSECLIDSSKFDDD